MRAKFEIVAVILVLMSGWALAGAMRADIPALAGKPAAPAEAGKKKNDFEFHLGYESGHGAPGARREGSVGVGGGLSEGKPLEAVLWSGAGAVVGSLAGPVGAIVGAAIGAVGGMLIAIFVVPHDSPAALAGQEVAL